MVIEAQGPGTVVWAFFYRFIRISSWFYHISVSGQYCPNFRPVLEQQVKRCERLNASTISASQKTILALQCALRLQAKRGAFAAPILRFSRIFHICCASPISGVRMVALIVLAQHKRNERIGKAWTSVCRASSIVIELAYKFCCTDWKRKYVEYKTTTN